MPGAEPQVSLATPNLKTEAAPLEDIFWTPVHASLLLQGMKPEMDSQVALDSGTIRGRIRLQGRTSSLGSYVEVGNQVTFADGRGYFEIQRASGAFDLAIRAPGHLSETVRNVELAAGEVIVISTVTLPFGDGDGNGVVDIFDISMAALNFGEFERSAIFR